MSARISGTSLVGLALLVALVSPIVARAQEQAPVDIQAVAEKLVESTGNLDVVAFAVCYFGAAIRGHYDARVRVGSGATVDGVPRVFEMSGGKLSERVDPQGLSGLMVAADRSGTVSFQTREEVFERQVSFFISDVTLESPTMLRYTVTTNPALVAEPPEMQVRAAARIETTNGQMHWEIVDTPQSFGAKNEPQTFRFKISPSDWEGENTQVLLSIVSHGPGGCLVSNEIDLKELLKPRKPEP